MTEYRVTTQRQWIRPRPAAATGWRGLSLTMASSTPATAPGDAIAFDTVLAETDGIATTGSNTFGAYTVPAGAGGEVPAGMAGWWRLGINNEYVPDLSSGLYALMIVVNNFSWFIEKSYIWTPPDSFTWSISPVVRELAEGDVVWGFANVQGTCDIGGPDATLLMEFLGPVPTEPS